MSEGERRRAIANERARVARVVERLLKSGTPLELRPTTAAIVFFHEAVHTEPFSDDPEASRVGRLILGGSEMLRRSILLSSLQALACAPLTAPSWRANVICDLRFVHDHHWGGLIEAILRTGLIADDALIQAVLQRLSNLADRFESNFPTSSYPFPFAAVVSFVHKRVASCSGDAIAPAASRLLDSIKRAVARDLVTLKGYGEREARSLAAEPGEWFAKADRAAISLIEGWVPH